MPGIHAVALQRLLIGGTFQATTGFQDSDISEGNKKKSSFFISMSITYMCLGSQDP